MTANGGILGLMAVEDDAQTDAAACIDLEEIASHASQSAENKISFRPPGLNETRD